LAACKRTVYAYRGREHQYGARQMPYNDGMDAENHDRSLLTFLRISGGPYYVTYWLMGLLLLMLVVGLFA
jgi:hypothetical protein